MIVESMTHEEVFKELERDRENLGRWWLHRRDELRRGALKQTRFPYVKWYDYTSPRKIRYIVGALILGRKYRGNSLSSFIALRYVGHGYETFSSWLPWQDMMSPFVILPHVRQRYAERCGIEKRGIELIRHFTEHNIYGVPSENHKAVGRSVRYNGEWHMSFCVNEGVLLGQRHGDIFVARTFITYDMCRGLQQEEFDEKRKDVMSPKEYNEQIKELYRKQHKQ